MYLEQQNLGDLYNLVVISQSPHCQPLRQVTADMQPLSWTTWLMNNPGLVDLPKSHKSSSKVAANKDKKKEIAAANAKKKQEQVARVARVKKEIRVAQEGGQSMLSQVKRSSPCDSLVNNQAQQVSHLTSIACPSDDSFSWLTLHILGHAGSTDPCEDHIGFMDPSPSTKTESFHNTQLGLQWVDKSC